MSEETTADELVARVQELQERLDEYADPRDRELAEALVGAVVELYGEGMRRIVGVLDDGGDDAVRAPRAAGRGRGGGQPAADPRPLPGSAGGARGRRRSTRCVPTSSRTAATWSCSGSRTASPACGCRAAARPARRRRRRWSWRSSRRSTRRHRTSRGWWSREWRRRTAEPASGTELPVLQVAPGTPGVTPSWHDLDGAAGVEEGRVRHEEIGGVPLLVARVDGVLLAFRDSVRRLRRGAVRRARCWVGSWLPGMRAAASTCRAPDARSTTADASSSRCRWSPATAAHGSPSRSRWTPGQRNGAGREALEQRSAGRRRADLVSGLRGLSRSAAGAAVRRERSRRRREPEEQCDLCGTPLAGRSTATCFS